MSGKKKSDTKNVEDEHLLSRGNVMTTIQGMQKNLQEDVKGKKSIVDTDCKYALQVTLFKIPRGPGKLNKLLLPHGLIDETDEVCLFVKDLERGTKKDFTPTKDHFEEMLRTAGVTRVNRVIPVNEMKTNYRPFEARVKLCQSFDVFLADSRIYNRILSLTGQQFMKRKKIPIVVRMDGEDLNAAIQTALRYTIYRQNNTGNVISINVGKHNMTPEDITDNICEIADQLDKHLPGGWRNIKSIYVKPTMDNSLSIPIYLNDATGEGVEVPEKINHKEQVLTKKRKQVNEVLENVGFSKRGYFTSN